MKENKRPRRQDKSSNVEASNKISSLFLILFESKSEGGECVL